MAEVDPVEEGLDRFITRLGRYFAEFGLPPIASRLLGLLLIRERPLSLDAIAAALQVSRASVSTNARMLTRTRLIERVSLPGDRRDYYAFTAGGWEALIETDVQGAATLRAFADDALDSLGHSAHPARPPLQAAVEFLDFYAAELQATLARWRARARMRPERDGERPEAAVAPETRPGGAETSGTLAALAPDHPARLDA